MGGHYFVTSTIDLTLWAAALLTVTRALLRDARWWLAAGAVLGVAADNKLLVAILVISLAAGILALGPRSVLRSRHLWAGVVIALVLAAPTLIYQATHHFPQLTMARALHDNNAGDVRAQLIPYQVLLIGPPLFVVVVIGFVALLRRPAWRPVRGLALAAVVALAVTFVAGGQIYYAFGLLAFLLAAGWATDRGPTWLLVAAIALNGAVNAFIALPLLPLSHVSVQAALNPTIGDQVGWPTYVATLRAAYERIPAGERRQVVVFTGNYGEAGAVARYGRDLPPVFSGQNELYFEGPPPQEPQPGARLDRGLRRPVHALRRLPADWPPWTTVSASTTRSRAAWSPCAGSRPPGGPPCGRPCSTTTERPLRVLPHRASRPRLRGRPPGLPRR